MSYESKKKSKIYFKKLDRCTCDDDPYSQACDFCLAQRGVPGYYKIDDIIKYLKKKNNLI